MSAGLSARRLAVETIRSDMFDGVVLASTLESLAGYYGGANVVTWVSDVRRSCRRRIADVRARRLQGIRQQ